MNPARVLVVEDNQDFQSLLKIALEQAGYAVQGALNGVEALAALRVRPADIVITDLNMPGGPGVEAIATLRRDFPDVKIIAMSAGPGRTKDDLAVARIVGADATLRKPFDLQSLIDLVASMARN